MKFMALLNKDGEDPATPEAWAADPHRIVIVTIEPPPPGESDEEGGYYAFQEVTSNSYPWYCEDLADLERRLEPPPGFHWVISSKNDVRSFLLGQLLGIEAIVMDEDVSVEGLCMAIDWAGYLTRALAEGTQS